jgi:Domain of unknown function (DUF4403)
MKGTPMPPESDKKKSMLGLLAVFIGVAVAGVAVGLWLSDVSVAPIPPPEHPKADFAMPSTTSSLSVAVTSPTASIKAILEQAVPKSFKFDDNHGVRAYGEPTRGEITVVTDIAGKRVNLSSPVTGKVQVEKQVLVKISVGIETKGSISASLSPVVGKDWSIDPKLDLSAKLEKASTKIAGIDVDITGLVEGVVKGAIDGVKQKAQGEVAKALNARGDIEKIWNQINSVHQFSKSPSVWLRITPKKATFGQIDYKPDALSSGLALEIESHVFIQDQAPELLKSPLPELLLAASLPGEYHLSIPVEISYTDINKQLKTELAKNPISLEGDVSVTITDATAQPYGDGVLLAVKFKGKKGYFKSASGTLYVSGIPAYDKATSELRIDQLNYTAETKNILLKSVEWLAHSTLLDKMKAVAVVKLEGEVKKATDKAREQLAGLKKPLPKEIAADVTIDNLVIERIVFAKERAFAVVKANGKLSAQVQK